MFVRSNIYAFIWAFLIFLLSFASSRSFPKGDILTFDKLLHLLFYLILTVLVLYGLKRQYTFPKIRSKAEIVALVSCSIYGLLIEYMQPIISDRFASFSDFLANFIGSVLGLIAFKIIYKI
jgi:VanZ family protein